MLPSPPSDRASAPAADEHSPTVTCVVYEQSGGARTWWSAHMGDAFQNFGEIRFYRQGPVKAHTSLSISAQFEFIFSPTNPIWPMFAAIQLCNTTMHLLLEIKDHQIYCSKFGLILSNLIWKFK